MKIDINDDCRSLLIAVLRLDGSPAVEGTDFASWQGPYHKNGRWSYTEAGVALKDGLVIVNRRSTHASADNIKVVVVVKNNEEVGEYRVMGKFSETESRPRPPEKLSAVWDCIISAILEWGNPTKVAEMKAAWDRLSKFE